MAILLTGGAGYIGSHCYYEFKENLSEEIVVIDNFSTGDPRTLPDDTIIVEGNFGDKSKLSNIFEKYNISAVIHFGGSLIVEESVYNPGLYYQNNVANTLSLLDACVEHNIKKFIFSSTASIYGSNPKQVMTEREVPSPENPYATSKLIVENILEDYSKAYGMDYVILRYFNVAGCDPEKRTGQYSKKVTHLIKIACELAVGARDKMYIFGDDYETNDGTCVRDYIHVSDLAAAHLEAFKLLQNKSPMSEIYNCGYGKGFSVKEVITELEKLTGKKLNVEIATRRPGDPTALIADPNKLKSQTGWKPKYNDFAFILKTAFEWERYLQQEVN